MTLEDGPLEAFIKAACAPMDAPHSSGSLEAAEAILAAHPEIAGSSVHTASILGDDAAVRRFLDADPDNATAKAAPHGWDALTCLCFSRYLKLRPARSEGFVRAASALLDAGASANSGWWENNHEPRREWESVLYGAAGIAHDPELTRLLLERGANPNDEEVVYHSPESYDNCAMKVVVETGQLTAEHLSLMLIRKHDWHDFEGIKWLLEHGADTNKGRWRGFRPLHHALARDNSLAIIELLLDHGADPTLLSEKSGTSAVALAARRGRRDVLDLFEQRGIPLELHGVEKLIAACARNDRAAAHELAREEPQLLRELVAEGGQVLAEFAGVGNAEGVRALLDLGVPVNALFKNGVGYWGIARNSTALHVAAWRARHATVKLLIERGAEVDAQDAEGRTPLTLAVRACVDSYWMDQRTPESVEALLRAGASISGVAYPSGYAEVDQLLKSHAVK